MIREIELAVELKQVHAAMKKMYGTRWPKQAAAHRKHIAAHMLRTGETNPLAAVIPVAKEMAAEGVSPAMVIAVAVEMASDTTPPKPQPNPSYP